MEARRRLYARCVAEITKKRNCPAYELTFDAGNLGDDPVPYHCCMMGLEWRVFFPAEESSDVLDVWSLLQPRDRPRGSPERRSDVYIKCSPAASLVPSPCMSPSSRAEGERGEVKLRSTKKAAQGTELWMKASKDMMNN